MANQTVKDAVYIKGTNPQHLVEKIIRSRIYDCRYWKEECFALTAELLVDKAVELKSIGGVYGGNVKPSSFLCLVLKMLQIQPEKEIIIEFIRNEDYKYVRALGAFYMRLTGASVDVYKYLEPLYIDYRKMKKMNKNAKYELIHMDEFIDELLHSDRVCDIALPRLQKRHVLEELNELEPRISALDVNLDDAESSDEDDEEKSTKSESESGEEKKKRHNNNDENRKNKDKSEKSSKSSSRYKYTDYDNPNPEDDVKRYKKSPSPNRHSSRHERRRSRSRDDYRSSRRDRSRERDYDRDRDRDRHREKERRRDDSRHEKSRRKRHSSSRSRSRSKDRRKEKSRRKNHSSSRSRSRTRSRS